MSSVNAADRQTVATADTTDGPPSDAGDPTQTFASNTIDESRTGTSQLADDVFRQHNKQEPE